MTKTKELATIPNTTIGQVIAMIEALSVLGNKSDRSGIAIAMGVKDNSANAPISGGLTFGFVEIVEKIVVLTEFGRDFLESDNETRKTMIGKFLTDHEPFATILRALSNGPLTKDELLRFLKAKLPKARTWTDKTDVQMFRVIKNWCEFGNLLKYDSDTKTFSQY